jgi:hypothetical protein
MKSDPGFSLPVISAAPPVSLVARGSGSCAARTGGAASPAAAAPLRKLRRPTNRVDFDITAYLSPLAG